MRKSRKRFSPTPMLIVCGGVLFAVFAIAQNRQPTVQPKARATRGAAPSSVRIVESSSTRKPLEYYTNTVREDLFSPAAAPAPKVEPPKVDTTPIVPAPVNPFIDFAYTGSIQMGDEMVALIENAKTKEGMFLKVGDTLVGGSISKITDREVEVTVAGRSERLQKNENYKVVSLDKDAPFLTSQPNQRGGPGQPGMPGMPVPGMMPGMPGAGPGQPGAFPGMAGAAFGGMSADRQARMQQWMQNMSPDARQRFQQRMMNRQFDGGGGRRRFGGG